MNWPSDIKAFVLLLEERLKDIYPPSEARAITRFFWDYSFEMKWTKIWEEGGEFKDPFLEQARRGAERLLNSEPVQYVVGWAHFYGYDFRVNKHVLIPRPDTEGLVLWIKEEWLSSRPSKAPRLLDVGTGSGCIPITLGMELKKAGLQPSAFYGMDLSAEAIALARKNAEDKPLLMHWLEKDVLEASPDDFSQLDILVSNPPYVSEAEKDFLDANVREYEPELALFVKEDDPLVFYKAIAHLGRSWLKKGGKIYFEIHADRGAEVRSLLSDLDYKDIELRQDLGERDRMVKACKR